MAFVPIASVDRSAFRWLRSAQHPTAFSLLSGDSPVARLAWSRPTGSAAIATSAEGSWTLEHRGFLNPTVVVRAEGQRTPIARLTAHVNHHTIEVAGGSTYRLHRAGMLLPAWKVTSANGEEVLHIEPAAEGRNLVAGAVLPSASETARADLLVLVLLSWYFVVLAWFEDETIRPLEQLQEAAPGYL